MTTLHRGLTLFILGALVLGAGSPVAAKPTPTQKCTAAKVKAAAKKLSAKLACYAKAATKNAPVDDECLGKAETSFRTAFSKAESKGGCITSGDATAVEAGIEAFVQSLATALPDGGTKDGGKCASGKRKAAGKKAMAKLLCYAKSATKNVPVDAGCLGKAEANLEKAFSKAEKKGGCTTSGDAATVEDAVDAIVAQVVAQLTTPPTTTTTATTTTAGGPTTTATGPTTTATGASTTSTTMAPAVHVVMVGPNDMLVFDPASLPIHVGETVRWVWATSFHSVVSGTVSTDGTRMPDGLFCSPNNTACDTLQTSNAGDTYERTFNTTGTFPYYCAPHGNMGMVGTIVVQP